jgi:hypothetical protein
MRQMNLVIHILARTVNFLTSFQRFEIIPFCIEFLVIKEMQKVCLVKKINILWEMIHLMIKAT